MSCFCPKEHAEQSRIEALKSDKLATLINVGNELINNYDVIIIGAGASGLMCAARAAARGRTVLVLEKANKVGKKILMSGGGRCNFTNLEVLPQHYLCQNPHFVKSALKRYSQWDFIGLVLEYGIDYHERDHGQLFCDHSAKDILNLLLAECEKAGADIRASVDIKSVSANSPFALDTSMGKLQCESLVIASGGLSIPTLGGSSIAYDLAQQFNLPLLPRSAGLVPFTFTDHWKPVFESLAGIALPCTVSCNGQSFTEAVLFTHRGLSGPAILQISNYWAPGDNISLDLMPDKSLEVDIQIAKQQQPKILLRTYLTQYLPKALVKALEQQFWADIADKSLAEIADKRLLELTQQLHAWELRPSGTEGYRTAEVTRGGIDTDVVSSKTFAVQSVPGLFVIGEALDVTGHLGGYNFQWAWSSGVAAAEHV